MELGSPSFLLAWRPTGAAVLAAGIEGFLQNPAVLLGAAAVVVVAVLIVLIMILRGGSRKAELAPEMEEEQERWEPAPRGAAGQSARGYDPRDQMLPWEQGGARADGGRQQPGGRRGQPGWGQDQTAQWEPQGQPAPRGGQWVGTDEWAPPEPAMGRGSADLRAQSQMGPRENNGWAWGAGQASPAGQNADQWGQGPAVSHPRGRDDQWGQPAPMRGRGQDQWGQAAPMGPGAGQPAGAFDLRGGPQRGGDLAGQAEGQWGQGSWGQANAGWNGGEPSDQWGQSASPAQPSPAARPGASRSGSQGGLAGLGGQPQPAPAAGGSWGERSFNGPASGGAQPGSGWGDQEPPAWQAEPRREQSGWEAPGWQSAEPPGPASGQRSQPLSSPRRDQPERGSADPAWGNAGAAGEWGQPAPTPGLHPSRPIEPAGARGASQPLPPGGDWGSRDFDRPTAKPAPQSPGWEQREAPPWQSPPPQMAAPSGPLEPPTVRPMPDARQLGRISPESTAYAPAPEGGAGEADKTVVMRKDAGAGAARIPAVVVRQGKEPGRTYDMRKDHISIGRSRESDIFLEDLAVSRLHATIYRDEMGGYLLRDENSANGTSVNGQRVTECALQEGDEIQLGQTILAFVRR